MAKKVIGQIKLQIPAGKATPAPPVGPALGQHGVNRSFSFITKTPPAAVLLKKAAGLDTASGEPNKKKVATLSSAKVREIAELKMPDLNAASVESAMSMIAGTARSMGIVIED